MDKAKKYVDKPIKVAAATYATNKFNEAAPFMPLLYFAGGQMEERHTDIRNAVENAYKQAGLGPEDLDLIELQDTCSSNELIYSEVILRLQEGEADRLLEKGATALGGEIPINVSGGSSSFGEAISAQGFLQIYELVQQLRGQAGERQVKDARIGLAQQHGGHGYASAIILEKV